MSLAQCVRPMINACRSVNFNFCSYRGDNQVTCRFSATKIMYAPTKPICETTMEPKMRLRIHGPYRAPPISSSCIQYIARRTSYRIAPPKLPETTNLASTKSRKEYKDKAAIKTKRRAENRRPPLKNLEYEEFSYSHSGIEGMLYARPRNRTPVPTNPFKS